MERIFFCVASAKSISIKHSYYSEQGRLLMIEKLTKDIFNATKKMEDISNNRIKDIIDFIKNKVNVKEIKSIFVTNTQDSYPDVEDAKNTPVQIDILTDRFLFELEFAENTIRYDYTILKDVGIPSIEIRDNKVKFEFSLRGMPYQTVRIATYDPNKFDELLSFINAIEKLVLRYSVD